MSGTIEFGWRTTQTTRVVNNNNNTGESVHDCITTRVPSGWSANRIPGIPITSNSPYPRTRPLPTCRRSTAVSRRARPQKKCRDDRERSADGRSAFSVGILRVRPKQRHGRVRIRVFRLLRRTVSGQVLQLRVATATTTIIILLLRFYRTVRDRTVLTTRAMRPPS